MRNATPLPDLSVVMPVFNGLPYLPAAVESILAQEGVHFELIVVNDGSTDGSRAWLEQRAATDARIRLLHQKQAGNSSAMRAGAGASRAEYIAVMDSDDIALPTRLVKQWAAMRTQPDWCVLGSYAVFIDDTGHPLGAFKPPSEHDAICRALLRGDWATIIHPTAMIRREAYERAGGYRAEFRNAGDIALWLRMKEVGQLANLPEVLLGYRQHSGSASYEYSSRQENYATKALEEARMKAGLASEPLTPFRKPQRTEKWACAWDCARMAHESRRRGTCLRLCLRILRMPGAWPKGAAKALALAAAEILPGTWRSFLCRKWRKFPFYIDPRLAAHGRPPGPFDAYFKQLSRHR